MAVKFSDIDDLYVVWNASESAVDKTGNVINSVTGVLNEGTNHTLQLTQKNGASNIEHGVATIGAMASFSGPDVQDVSGLTLEDVTGIGNAYTFVWVEQRYNTGSGLFSYNTYRTGNGGHSSVQRFGSNYRAQTNANTVQLGSKSITTDPAVFVHAVGGVQDVGKLVIDGVADVDPLVYSNIYEPVSFALLNAMGSTTSSAMRGKMSIFAVYARMLTDSEITEVTDLCNYWIANGSAPPSGPPTTVTFGPVTTNDDPSVTSWSWEASADGGSSWDEAENVLSDVSGEATTSLVVNSATLAEDQTQVRCRAISAKEPGGVESAVATLTVQAAS